MTISPIWGHAPAERTETKFGIRGRVPDVIMCFKFYRNQLRGFLTVTGQK